MPHIQSGKLRALVNFGLERIPDLPDVPTLKEAGCMPFEGGTTAGVFVRLETPKPIVERLNKAVVRDSRTRRRTSVCASWAPSCGPRHPPSSPRS